MRKLFSVYGITSFIFLMIGSMFMMFTYLIDEGMMTAHSQISLGPEVVFAWTGLLLFIIGLIFLFMEIRKRRIYNTIIKNGDYMRVKVTKVKHDRSIKVNRRSPYVVYAVHSDLPHDKQMKSFLLWERPNIIEGDRIKVLTHSKYPYNFVIEE